LSDGFEDQWKDVDGFIEMGRTALGILPEDERTEVEVGEAKDEEEEEWNEDGANMRTRYRPGWWLLLVQ
jgi:hypothetical protein